MKKLTLKDVFLFGKIVKKIDLKNSGIDFTNKETDELGKDIVFYLIENMDKAEKETGDFLNNIFECDNALEMPLEELVCKFSKENGELKNFFQSVSKSVMK